MSQVYGLKNEPKDTNAGGFWKNLTGKLGMPFEKYASANKKQAEQDKSAMLTEGSFTPIGEVKPKEMRLVAGGTEITIKTSATQKKELEGLLNKIVGSLKYLDDSFLKTSVQITNEEKVKDIKGYIEANSAMQRAKAVMKEAEKEMATLEPKLMEYFKASDAQVKLLEIEAGFVQLSEKPVRAVPSYKNVVEEVKKKLTDFSDLIDKLVKKHTPSGTKPTIEVHPREGKSFGKMNRIAMSPAELDDARDTINEAVNDLKIVNNLVKFLLDESASVEIPGQQVEAPMPGMEPEMGMEAPAPEMAPEMEPAMAPASMAPAMANKKWSLFRKAEPKAKYDKNGGGGEGKYEIFYADGTSDIMNLSEIELDTFNNDIPDGGIVKTKYLGPLDKNLDKKTRGGSASFSMRKKADGTQGTWDIDNYKNVDKCRDCAFFQSDPAGSHLNKCHDCIHYKLNGTIDYYKSRATQIVTDAPSYKAPETKPAGGKKAFVGTIGISKEAKKPKVEEPIKTQDESLESKLAKKEKKKEEEPIKTQVEGLENRFSFKGTIGMPKKADFADEHGIPEGDSPIGTAVKTEKIPDPNDPEEQLEVGEEIEKEHLDVLEQIIADAEAGALKPIEEYIEGVAEKHIQEIKDYYTRLVKMEDEAKAEGSFQQPTQK